MIEFKHSGTASIRCPRHNQREPFTAGSIIQPINQLLVRYPCGYVDGLASASPDREPALLVPRRDELVKELANRMQRLEERQVPRRTPPRTEPVTPPKKGGVAL